MPLNIKSKFTVLIIHVQCMFLYLRNIVFWQKLSVKNLMFINNLNLQTNEAEVFFDVTGCYKIFIKGGGTFSGKRSRIKYFVQSKNKSIEITFFGIGGDKETKIVPFENAPIKLKDCFNIRTKVPQLSSTKISDYQIECLSINSLEKTKRGIIDMDFEPSYLLSNNLNVSFKTFIKSDYPK